MYPCPHRLDADRCPMCLHARIEDLRGTITELRVNLIDTSEQLTTARQEKEEYFKRAAYAEGRALEISSQLGMSDRALASARAQIEHLRTEGTPGIMSPVDAAFYELTVKERNTAWEKVNHLEKELTSLRDHDGAGRVERVRKCLWARMSGVTDEDVQAVLKAADGGR